MTAEELRAGEIVIDDGAPFVVGLFTRRSQEQPDWQRNRQIPPTDLLIRNESARTARASWVPLDLET